MTEENKTEEQIVSNGAGDEVSTEQLELEQDQAFQSLQSEIEDLRNKALYAQAETQNVRRRLEKEKQDAAAYAATGFARDILSVSDNLARALASISPDLRGDERLRPLITGLEMTGKELENIFQRNGITKIEAMGQALDPNRHQAMIELEREGVTPGTVVEEMQAGYMIRDRLLRPALVGIAKAAATGKVDLEA
jgi:molecular chaperone GrpE